MLDELTMSDARLVTRLPDAIDVAVGCGHYVYHHWLGDLHLSTPMGRTARLRVSRFYWDLDQPVAVDFVRSVQWGEEELAAKKAYCVAHGIRYILVRDEFDGESAETALLALEPGAEIAQIVKNAAKPLTGPRRGR